MEKDKAKNRSKWYWGVFFILAAIFIVINQMGYLINIGFWSMLFTIFLIPVFVECVIHRTFTGIFFSLAFLCIIYAGPLGIEQLVPWPVLLTALFLSIGCSIIFNRKSGYCHIHHHIGHIGTDEFESEEYLDENEISCKVSFGSSAKYLSSQNLKKARIDCNFGAMKIYFDNTQLAPEGATVVFHCSFSGLELYIPKTWKVQQDTSLFLSGITEKNRSMIGDGPVLTLAGEISFSGVEIIYI